MHLGKKSKHLTIANKTPQHLPTSPTLKWREMKKSLRRVWLFATPWTIQSMEFFRPEYWPWVAVPFSRETSQPRDQTQVSHTAGRFFTNWATREAFPNPLSPQRRWTADSLFHSTCNSGENKSFTEGQSDGWVSHLDWDHTWASG